MALSAAAYVSEQPTPVRVESGCGTQPRPHAFACAEAKPCFTQDCPICSIRSFIRRYMLNTMNG